MGDGAVEAELELQFLGEGSGGSEKAEGFSGDGVVVKAEVFEMIQFSGSGECSCACVGDSAMGEVQPLEEGKYEVFRECSGAFVSDVVVAQVQIFKEGEGGEGGGEIFDACGADVVGGEVEGKNADEPGGVEKFKESFVSQVASFQHELLDVGSVERGREDARALWADGVS